MSALRSKADMAGSNHDVRLVPEADIEVLCIAQASTLG